MSAYKNFLAKDVIVTPLTVNKKFTQAGIIPTSSETGPFRSNGKNEDYPLGGNGSGSVSLVYNNINQLYYSNFPLNTGKVAYSGDFSVDLDGNLTGPTKTPSYDNTIQSIDELRYFPTQSGGSITVLSIPQKLFGDYVVPGSFTSATTYDDGQGNIRANNIFGTPDKTNKIIGNIIYGAGMVIFTGVTGSGDFLTWQNLKWESAYTIYETQYKCTIRANEFNYSLNPSLLSSSQPILSGSTEYKDFVTASFFSPYVTTVGLYNDNKELLAIGKLAQPLPTSQTTDTTILINLDR